MENREEKIGDKIAKLRTENKYSQEKLAEKLNVSRQTIYQWECNAQIPKTDKLILICKLFNKNITYFIPPIEDESNDDNSCQQENVLEDKPVVVSTSHKQRKKQIGVIILLSFLSVITVVAAILLSFLFAYNEDGDNTVQLIHYGLNQKDILILIICATILILAIFTLIIVKIAKKIRMKGKHSKM